jgi:hypothetical protein
VKEDNQGRAYSTHEESMNAYNTLVGNPEGEEKFGRRSFWLENNIKVDLRYI